MPVKTVSRIVTSGKIYIIATFNNTIATLTNREGMVLAWNSSGSSGFRGARKSTPYAATATIENLLKKAAAFGLKEIEVYIKGPGPGRDAVLRTLRTSGLSVSLIADVTPIPHNGPRPPKRRRV